MNIFNSNSLTSLNFCPTNFPHCAEMNFNQLPLHPIKNEYQLNCSTIRQHPQILKKSYRTRKSGVGSFHYNEKKCKLTNLLELSFLDVFAFPKASSIKFVKRTSFSIPEQPPPRAAKYCIAIFAVSVFPDPLSPL